MKLKDNVLKELRQEFEQLKPSVVQSSDPVATLAETLPEISFETVFIDNSKNICRETRKARQLTEILPNEVKLEMIYIPGGTFMMGSNDCDNEKPVHSVTLKSFFIGKYLVTQEQWRAVMGNNPSKFKGLKRPVERVTWHDAIQFCMKLSQVTGSVYCLPSEAQWEYACRANANTKYNVGEVLPPNLANYYLDDGIKQTTTVGNYPANAFGLYDTHGNVWEWCEDVWHENYVGAPSDGSAWVNGESDNRIIRGGSWGDSDSRLRCASRNGVDLLYRSNYRGVRISRM